MEFVHLHVHSHFSLLDGLSKLEEITDRVKEFGSPAVALTDHGNMYGAIDFYFTCKKKDLKPIVGLEAYITSDLKKPPSGTSEAAYNHLTLLAQNYTGYQNLMKLTTQAHLEGWYYRPRIDHQMLGDYKEGLIVLSGCLFGELPQAILAGNEKKARKIIEFYKELLGKDYYLEVQYHPNIPEQARVNEVLFTFSREYGIPLVATSDAHYINKDDLEAHDILLCIQTNSQMEDANRFTMRNEIYDLTDPKEIAKGFSNHPEALENTLKIAQEIDLVLPLSQFILPHFPLPPGVTPSHFLRQEVLAGIKKRKFELTPEAKERLEYELSVIEKMGYETYFLVVADSVI